jgi:preprotein translocase subunit SecD
MYKNLRWKLLTIAAVAALAIGVAYPPGERIRLGLDLKGGMYLVLKVQTEDALKIETDTSRDQLAAELQNAGIKIAGARSTGSREFVIEGIAPADDARFRQIADQWVGTSFDRVAQAAGTYAFQLRPGVARRLGEDTVTQAIDTIERRVNALGVAEAQVARYGSEDQIVIQLPGLRDVARAKSVIQSTAMLELKIVEDGPYPDQASLLQKHGGQAPAGLQVVPGAAEDPRNPAPQFYLVRETAAVSGTDVRNARVSTDEYNRPAVAFTLNSEGQAKFSKVTAANVNRLLAIILDGQVRSAPVIQEAISTAEARITGTFTQQEVQDLALILKSGALPASLTYQESREVGPTLGADSVRAGIIASLMGLLFVTLFMLVYYKLAGINALVSIALNLLILLGFMAYLGLATTGLGAAMTLPGIAGLILTIGMGVDSNVLIFERIREEAASKKSARQAVAAGFDRVFVTIVDTHVASLIAAGFLFAFGTGPIRGFATTLFFGLISNVFTAVFVSRTLFELILSRRPAGATQLSI